MNYNNIKRFVQSAATLSGAPMYMWQEGNAWRYGTVVPACSYITVEPQERIPPALNAPQRLMFDAICNSAYVAPDEKEDLLDILITVGFYGHFRINGRYIEAQDEVTSYEEAAAFLAAWVQLFREQPPVEAP
jgi:hypothetical protein